MSAENIRTSSTYGSIPAATTMGGTFSDAASATRLVNSGGATVESIFGVNKQLALKNNIYAYDATGGAANVCVRKITAVNGTGTTWSLTIESALTSTQASGKTIGLVVANLSEVGVVNDGGADGVFDGVTLAAGSGVTDKGNSNTKGNTRLAKAFNATGTTFLITEFK